MPAGLRPRLQAIAEPIVAAIDPVNQTPSENAPVRLEAYLRESGKFTYTLEMEIIDPSLIPLKISWSIASRAIASISPAHLPCCCAPWVSDLESSMGSRAATGTSSPAT